jgi:phosphoglycerate kinase
MRKLSDLPSLKGQAVVLRCDLNVPLSAGEITDDGRILASVPTIQYLLKLGAKVVVVSHLGRPDGTVDQKYSLRPVATRLGEVLEAEVLFAEDTVGPKATAASQRLKPGQVLVLENLRFDKRETSKVSAERQEFAEALASFGDVFVSDGFGVVHREQASVFELAKLLPAAAGLLIEAELEVLTRLTTAPERPLTVVLGGSKVSDKLGVIDKLLPTVDKLLIGGGMAFTFLAAQGYKVAASLLESDQIATCKEYLSRAVSLGVEIILPTDITVASKFAKDADFIAVPANQIESSPYGATGIGLDIGPESAARFAKEILSSKTVFWNGPMGVFEFESFSRGTFAVADALSKLDGYSVVGGGDSAAAIRLLGFEDSQFSHISTGGGASLEFLEGKKLPGLEVLG